MYTLPDEAVSKGIAKEIVMAAGHDHTPEELNEIRKIHDTQNTYFWCVDYKFWDVAKNIFTEDFSAYYNGVNANIKDVDDQVAFLAKHEIEELVPMHMSHNTIVQLTGEKTARVLTKLNSHHTYSDNDETYQAWGQYINDYEKGEDGYWRIKVLRLTFRKRIGAFRPFD